MMIEWYDQIQRDMRLASRRAVRHATFTVIVVICLALGIAATTSVFAVLHPVILKPMQFEDPDELVQVGIYNVHRSDPDQRFFLAWLPIEALRRDAERLEGVAAFYQKDLDILDGAEPERIAGAETVPGSFEALGIRPLLGRTLREDDMRSGRRVALISEPLWSRRYARDPGVLGTTIRIGDEAHEIVGVIPGDLQLHTRAELFPVYQPSDYTYREHMAMGVFMVIVRLPEGADHAAAEADLAAARRAVTEVEPIFYGDYDFDVKDLREALVGDFRRPLWALMAAALFVLLLASANVANLLMARAQGEAWENGLRTALGARCRRIATQNMVENSLLAGLGAIVGLGAGAYGAGVLLTLAPLSNPAFDEVGFSVPVVLATLAITAALAAVMSVIPAVRCYASMALIHGGRSGGIRKRDRRLQTGFVVAQVALSFVLLVGAGLMARSTANLSRLDLGFETESLVTVRASAPPSLADTPEGRTAFSRDVVGRIARVGGVDAVGAVSWIPFVDGDVGFNYSVQDFPPQSGGERQLHPGRIITPGYFEAMAIPLLAGRIFTDADDAEAPPVAIVSRAFQELYWPGGSALGRRIKRGAYDMDRPWIEIVGVVEDIRSGLLSDPIQPAMYYPQAQTEGAYVAQMAYIIRTAADPESLIATVRAAVGEVAAEATVYDASTGAEIRSLALGRARFNSLVVGLFALVGLVLAAAGVFGVTSYGVGRRTREFGLRVALGARPTQVRRLVLRGAVGVAAVGIGLGAMSSAALMTGVSELLYEVEAGDAWTYLVVASALAGSVLLATYVPARRATCVDPTIALKGD